jgi:hypothetical protein
MKRVLLIYLLLQVNIGFGQTNFSSLPVWYKQSVSLSQPDWLLNNAAVQAGIYRSADNKDIVLDNGLIKRSFRLQPNLACTDFTNLSTGEQMLRAISPEARITISGKVYQIGGLYGQPEKAYLKSEWVDGLKANANDFQFKHYAVSAIQPYINWKVTNRWSLNKLQPTGKMLTFYFESASPALKGVLVKVNYELYDGLPLVCKWLSIENKGAKKITVDRVVNEILATVEEESSVIGAVTNMKIPQKLHVESNYAFNNASTAHLSDQSTHWKADTSYTSQVNFSLNTPCLLEVYPPIGPGVDLAKGEVFNSIRTNELIFDGYDRERNGLTQRMMYKTVAPWVTENPIFMHLISVDPKIVKNTIDQCSATGYEGIILSFGSGIDMENLSDQNISMIKELVDYAHQKNVILGCYSLFSSRKISDEDDVIDPKTGLPDVHAMYGNAPCLGSKWGLAYIEKLKQFLKRTGMDIFENDGPYAGDLCASTKHPGHHGVGDSQWAQMELQKGLYRWCSTNGVYVNAPDWYIFDGANKMPLGYRENNFSLTREQQVILNRQNIYDATWEKLPSMGWGFVPLTEYQGGGAAATIEPLADHLDVYEQLMMQYYGAGIQACYRGPRLYDTEKTKQMVIRVISWYKKYRTILNSPVIHLRRPDGRDWDGILHVNPKSKEKGLVMLYNPLKAVIKRQIRLPLYYTGLTKKALISDKDSQSKNYQMDKNGNVVYDVTIPANGYTWLVIQ